MRAIAINNTAKDLAAEKAPFLPNYTVVYQNPTAGALTVQESDSGTGDWTTVAVVPVHGSIEATPKKQFVRVSTSATVYVLGN